MEIVRLTANSPNRYLLWELHGSFFSQIAQSFFIASNNVIVIYGHKLSRY